jgi:hypothetical protein
MGDDRGEMVAIALEKSSVFRAAQAWITELAVEGVRLELIDTVEKFTAVLEDVIKHRGETDYCALDDTDVFIVRAILIGTEDLHRVLEETERLDAENDVMCRQLVHMRNLLPKHGPDYIGCYTAHETKVELESYVEKLEATLGIERLPTRRRQFHGGYWLEINAEYDVRASLHDPQLGGDLNVH